MLERIPEPGGYMRDAGVTFGVGTLRHPCESFQEPHPGKYHGGARSSDCRCRRCDFPRSAHEPPAVLGDGHAR